MNGTLSTCKFSKLKHNNVIICMKGTFFFALMARVCWTKLRKLWEFKVMIIFKGVEFFYLNKKFVLWLLKIFHKIAINFNLKEFRWNFVKNQFKTFNSMKMLNGHLIAHKKATKEKEREKKVRPLIIKLMFINSKRKNLSRN